jgi:hypothetical protein
MILTGHLFRRETFAPDQRGLLVHCAFINQLQFIQPNPGIRHLCISSRRLSRHEFTIRILMTLSKDCKLEHMGVQFSNGQGAHGLKPYGTGKVDKITFIQTIRKYDSEFITGKIYYRTSDAETVHSPSEEPFRIRLT